MNAWKLLRNCVIFLSLSSCGTGIKVNPCIVWAPPQGDPKCLCPKPEKQAAAALVETNDTQSVSNAVDNPEEVLPIQKCDGYAAFSPEDTRKILEFIKERSDE